MAVRSGRPTGAGVPSFLCLDVPRSHKGSPHLNPAADLLVVPLGSILLVREKIFSGVSGGWESDEEVEEGFGEGGGAEVCAWRGE